MLFAAGFGTRMGVLTADRPKPMIEVAGRPLIDHALQWVEEFGAAKVVVNLHYKPAMLKAHLETRDVILSHEPEILETGGGLRAALPYLGAGPVFTLNTDAVWSGPNPLRQLAARWNPETMDALLLCIPPAQAIGHDGGDFTIAPDGTALRGVGSVYSGLQILKTEGLQDIAEEKFSLNILWDRMLEAGRLHAVDYTGKWCDVGKPEGIRLAEAMLGAAHV